MKVISAIVFVAMVIGAIVSIAVVVNKYNNDEL